jgi:hypothetical protein
MDLMLWSSFAVVSCFTANTEALYTASAGSID